MTEPRGATAALARASADLVSGDDVLGHLVRLMSSCESVLGYDGSSVMVKEGSGLELLASTSHQIAALEVHQAVTHEGPCTEAFESGEVVDVAGATLRDAWPNLTELLDAGDFGAITALPLTYRSEEVGVLGLFRRAEEPLGDGDALVVAQAFADLATLAVVRSGRVDLDGRLRDALVSRVAVERAKGVLAETENLDMGEAYDRLLAGAAEAGTPLAAYAEQLVQSMLDRRS